MEWIAIAILACAVCYIFLKYDKKIATLNQLIELNSDAIEVNRKKIEENRSLIETNKEIIENNRRRLELNQDIIAKLKDC